ENLKHETRNSKQIRNANEKISKPGLAGLVSLCVWCLDFVSSFGFRISCLRTCPRGRRALWRPRREGGASRRERGATPYHAWRAGKVSQKLGGGGAIPASGVAGVRREGGRVGSGGWRVGIGDREW